MANESGGLKQIFPAGVLALLVVSVLALGAVLQHDEAAPERPSVPAPTATTRPALVLVDPAAPPPAPVTRSPSLPAEAPDGGGLAARARRDLARLSAAGPGFTVQVAAVCDAENVARLADAVGGDARLHLLPARIDGRDCYRLCWGHYATRDGAASAGTLPPALAGAGPGRVRAVDELTQ